MANASRDNNQVPVILGLLNSDGSTVTMPKADSSSNSLLVKNGTGGSDNGGSNAARDNNSVSTLIATSSSDGSTPVPFLTKRS
jgi:hypothetical protein